MPAPPTSILPPLARIATHPLGLINDALCNLRDFYAPPFPCSLELSAPSSKRPLKLADDAVPDSGYASAEEEDDEPYSHVDDEDGAEVIRSDPLERAFAIKWLTGFIARSDTWLSVHTASIEEEEARYEALDTASTLLAYFSASPPAESAPPHLTRRFSFAASSRTVDVELNDAPLSTEDHTSVGLQSWASAIVLAERICATPHHFGLAPRSGTEGGMRVLELGAGTGLLSIVAAKLLADSNPAVVATDYHPDVLSNLHVNIRTNFPYQERVHVYALDWEHPDEALAVHPLNEAFDVVLAADVIYHPLHAAWLRVCVMRTLARKPDAAFWLMIPLRGTGRHQGMGDTVDEVFGCEQNEGLVILERTEVGRLQGVGRADEGGYKLFKIGWLS